MDEAEARARLSRMVEADSAPALAAFDLDDLIEVAASINYPWQAETEYAVGAYVAPGNAHRYRVTVAGLTDATTEPTWPTGSGTTVTSGSVTFTEWGSPVWDLNLAAAEGWTRKAGKVAGAYDFATDGQSFDRSQMVEHCLAMAEYYRNLSKTQAPAGSDLIDAALRGRPTTLVTGSPSTRVLVAEEGLRLRRADQ